MPGLVTTLRGTRRGIGLLVALGVLVAGVAIWWGLGPNDEGTGAGATLGTRTVQAGEVEVGLTPLTLDSSGASFRVVLDTHTVALDSDVTKTAQLRVDGSLADGAATWSGSKPGGHHREGTLSFGARVPSGATVELRLGGLPEEVRATWSAP